MSVRVVLFILKDLSVREKYKRNDDSSLISLSYWEEW